MKNILIVGANSFLASKLVEKLKGNQIVGLIHKNDFRVNYCAYIKVYDELKTLFKERKEFDIIYLLGAYRPLGKIERPDINYVKSNVELIVDLSKAYSNARFVFSSSICVYGHPCEKIIKINTPLNSPNLYGLSKIAGETIIKNLNSYAILRFSTIWGKGIDEETFVPRVIKQALEKGVISIYGDGSRKQNYIHYEDAIEMCMHAAGLDENLVLLSVGKNSSSNMDIARAVATMTGASIRLINDDPYPSLIFDAEESFKKMAYWPQKDILRDLIELI